MSKRIYLESTPLHEAISLWLSKIEEVSILKTPKEEVIKVIESLGRVTSEAINAKISSPFYHSSAMDGYAVRFTDTFGASERKPKRLKIGEEAIYVNTGDPLPDGFNAVIMIEDVNIIRNQDSGYNNQKLNEKNSPEFIEIISPATPWQHIRVIGEDIIETELILPENQKIRPIDIGAMLAGGHVEIKVRTKPKVVIIPTGTELVEIGKDLKKGDIIEFNSRILSGLVSEWGGEPIRHQIVPDRLEELKEALINSIDICDFVVVNAGSSAGSEDFTAQAIKELGEIILHGVSIKPGKPVILGLVKGKPVLGIPGYPVSTYITFTLFAKPLIYKLQGLEMQKPEIINAKLSRQIASSLGNEEFVRVKVGKVGNQFIATPISRGAGVLMSLVRADGFVQIPAMSEGIGAGTEVRVELMRSKEDIENTIVCIGSHDNTLDILANTLKKKYPRFSLSSAHVGSMGGLIALKRKEAHIAGTHLLDEETGEYNVPFIKKLLKDMKIVLVNLVYREQGLLVLKGNPKNINGFHDLIRNDVVFINRQAGSGTRLLTDKCLKELSINPKDVNGYEHEEYTHMGVASAVLTGVADTGLAILASARALNLEFIPVAKERYDIVIPAEFYETEMLQHLLKIIQEDSEFRNMVLSLGGYDISDMGKIIFES